MSVSTLVLAVLVLWGIGSKTFAYTDANYISNFTPNGCNSANTLVYHLNSWDIAAGWSLAVPFGYSGVIFVIDSVPSFVTANLSIDSNCVSLVANGDAIGNTILNLKWWSYITSVGYSNIIIAGFDASHKLEINNATTSPWGILLQNNSWVLISQTTLSGFTVLWGIAFDHTTNSTISNSTFSNNKDGIWLQAGSHNTTVSNNTMNNNSEFGILLDGVSWCTVTSNIWNNNNYWIYLNIATNSSISNNTISTSSTIWIYVQQGSNNTFVSNIINNNLIWLAIDDTDGNTFTSNTISANTTYWVSMGNTSSGNIFNGNTTISSPTGTDVYLFNASHNQFLSTTIQSSLIGLQIDGSTFNTFSWVNVVNNASGVKLSTSSNNTFSLLNNTNGIYVDNHSNSNNIINTQILGQNNIFIYDWSSNNIITGGLFAATSTTTTWVTITLKNNQATPTYIVSWSGLTWVYANAMTGSTKILAIELTASNGTKDIFATYNNGNKQYDSISLTLATLPGGGSNGGWGAGGGWGGGWAWGGGLPVCTAINLTCTNGVRTLNTWSVCQWWNLAHSCTVGWTWNLPIGNITWSPYSTELNNAYLWAYAHSITTMNTIQSANMWWTLLRAHMAKMISSFAILLGGAVPNTNLSCTFADTANQSTEMNFYIRTSCQLGLMGINMTNFDPNGEVTRAQFWTILSRVIWGTTYNTTGTNYYASHLNALRLAGIMNNISNPNMKELRGYVMLMMKRTYEGGFLQHN